MQDNEFQFEEKVAPAVVSSSAIKVTFKHPNTGDVKVVNDTFEEMVPLMGRGYQQVREGV